MGKEQVNNLRTELEETSGELTFEEISAVEFHLKPWTVYDSSELNVSDTFRPFLGESTTISEYLLSNLPEGKIGNAIGLELGGPAVNFFKNLGKIFKKTAGVTLKNFTNEETLNHEVIEGNMFLPETQKKINAWLTNTNGDKNKIDFIFSRMEGGISHWPEKHFSFLLNNLNKYYLKLSENGIMFLQLPLNFYSGNKITNTKKLITDYFQNRGLSNLFGHNNLQLEEVFSENTGESCVILKIVKIPTVKNLISNNESEY